MGRSFEVRPTSGGGTGAWKRFARTEGRDRERKEGNAPYSTRSGVWRWCGICRGSSAQVRAEPKQVPGGPVDPL